MTILVTGGAGFIGANYVLRRLNHSDERVVVVDALTYAGNLESLAKVQSHASYAFEKVDIRENDAVQALFESTKPDAVVHFAAESHVDRSILGPRVFTETNVLGTQILLDASRQHGVKRFVMVSTDEVYGSLGPTGAFTEDLAATAEQPLQRIEGRRRPACALVSTIRSGSTWSSPGAATTTGPFSSPKS